MFPCVLIDREHALRSEVTDEGACVVAVVVKVVGRGSRC